MKGTGRTKQRGRPPAQRRQVGGALAGLRVVEFGSSLGWYCGKLLADLGAIVLRVEPPGGDVERESAAVSYLYMNTNKRSVVLDLARRDGRTAFRRLAGEAQLVLDAAGPGSMDGLGIGFEPVRKRSRGLVWTSITGFGLSGSGAEWRASASAIAALGGAMHVTGEASDPPVDLVGEQSWKIVSTVAAAASLIALHESRQSGYGQLVDTSALESVASVTHICGAAKFREDGIIARRHGTSLFASVPSGAYRCGDGRFVYLMINRPAHWRALARWVNETTGNVEVLDAMFEGPSSVRQPYRELLDLFIGDLFARMTAEDAYREAQRRHLAVTPVNGARDVVADPHLKARRYFVDIGRSAKPRIRAPGAPYRLSRTPWKISRGLPKAGEHTKSVLSAKRKKVPPAPKRCRNATRAPALAGIRVLELTAGMAGPWVGRFMAYCGADVIKVESRDHPDVTRLYVSPRDVGAGVQETASPWFTDWNAGKRFVALDLTHPAAVDVCKRLVACSDVVVCNYSVGVLDKLGLGYRVLRKIKPDLVMLTSTGFGASGPSCSYVTWGPNIEALSALSALSGFPNRECTITQYAYPDAVGALHGLVAVMAALAHRDRTGEGQQIDLSQYEAMVACLGESVIEAIVNKKEPDRIGNASRHFAPHGCYPCAGDDRWCVVGIETESEWQRLCDVIGRPDFVADEALATRDGRRNRQEDIDRAIAAWTNARGAYDVMRILQAEGIVAGVVQTIEDQLDRDPQLAERGFFERIVRRRGGSVLANGIPLRLSETPGCSGTTGAPVGADNREVLREILGLGDDEIAHLIEHLALQQLTGK